MNIMILQTGEPLHCDHPPKRPMRGMNLANAFVERGHKVTLISSAFDHQDKKHRFKKLKKVSLSKQLELILIPSPGYKKNISLRRLYDHFKLATNLYNFLKKIKTKPDFIFIGYPPIETSAIMTWWSQKNNIPHCIDIKDKWPHYFLTKFPNYIRYLLFIPLTPYFILGKYAMHNSTMMTSMSKSFLNWGQRFGKREMIEKDVVFPLTPPEIKISDFNFEKECKKWESKIPEINSRFVVTFVGSLSKAFNFELIKKVAKITENINQHIIFIICGDGDNSLEIQNLFKNSKNVFLTGWINVSQIHSLMAFSKISIAPYFNTKNFIDNLPNKILDSLYYGKPILTSLEGETKSLLKNENIGIYCEENEYSWAAAINKLSMDKKYYLELSMNAKRAYKEKFSFEKVYGDFVKKVELI